MRGLTMGVVGLVLMSLLPCQTSADSLSDHFNDGIIESNMWATHGYKAGYNGVGAGSWEYSITEGGTSQPGLQARVWGPTSADTYGAEAWVISKKNFNDGQTWLINFTWDTTVGYTPHGDGFSTSIVTTANPPDIQDMCGWIANDSRPDVRELWHYAIDMGVPYDQPNPPFCANMVDND